MFSENHALTCKEEITVHVNETKFLSLTVVIYFIFELYDNGEYNL